MDNNEERLAYLAHIASLYYDHGKNQQEIADEIGMTRSAVSRLLTEARERGIVEIVVHYPWRTSLELEKALMARFNLKAARVLVRMNKSYPEMLQGLGVLAAQYFLSILGETNVIGISWGSALNAMIQAIRPRRLPNLEVVQLIGATGSEKITTDGPLLAQLLADNFGCARRYLHAPLIVESEEGRKALLQERTIRDTIARAEQSEIALVGIGSTQPDLYSLTRAGYVNRKELEEIRAAGAIGDVCAHHYDIQGNYLPIGVNRRVMGISVETIWRIPTVIGVAGDAQKGEAILGALRGRYVNVLITDDQAAARVLALSD